MSLVDYAIWSFAWGGGTFSMEHVLVTASVSTYNTFIVGLSLLQTSQSLQSKLLKSIYMKVTLILKKEWYQLSKKLKSSLILSPCSDIISFSRFHFTQIVLYFCFYFRLIITYTTQELLCLFISP